MHWNLSNQRPVVQRSFQKTLKLVSVSTDKSRQSMGEQFLGEEEMGKVKTIYDRFMTSNIPVTQIETSCAWNLRKSYYIVNRFRLNIWEVKMKEYSMEPSRAGQNTLVWDELTSKRIIKRAHWYMKGQRKQPCACCQRSSWMWFVSAVHILHVFFFSFVSRHNFFL